MSEVEISFIIPIRGRDEMRPYLEKNIAEYFGDHTYEIIYVVQDDDEPFKTAQLRNIGFMNASGKYLVTRDVDIIDMNKIDIAKIYETLGGPYRAYNRRQHYKTDGGVLTKFWLEHYVAGYGGYTIYTKEDFEAKNGFTNLCFGWGSEDIIAQTVYKLKTYDQPFGHLYHEDLSNKTWGNRTINENVSHAYSRGEMDSQFDGYRQMTYNIVKDVQLSDKIREITVNNIDVVPDFKYIDIYNQQMKAMGH